MRIGFIVVKNPFVGGGIESYTYEVSKRLLARGHEVTIFSMGHYGETPARMEGIDIVRVPCIPGVATERITASLRATVMALLSRQQFDLLHFHTPMTGVFSIFARIFGYSTVVQMHGIDWKRSRWGTVAQNVIRMLERVVMLTAPVCTAVSKSQCAFYDQQYGRKVTYIPTGTDRPEECSEAGEIEALGLKREQYFLFTSRLVPEKGAEYLISAFRHLKTDMKLVIAGGTLDGGGAYTEKLRHLIADDPRIILPGFVRGVLKHQLLSHAAAFVLPSEIEGLSISLLDAMSYRRACIVSDIPENLEAIGTTGVTFRSGDFEHLQLQMERVVADSELRAELGAAASKRAAQLFSWDLVADSLENLYRSQIKAIPARARWLGVAN